jgi:hypothetical protein
MSIQWNTVTWYSKIVAVILFVATFFLGFWLGTMKAEKIIIDVPHIVARQENPTSSTDLSPTSNLQDNTHKHFYLNNSVVGVDKNFRIALGQKEYLDGPLLSYTRNTQTITSKFSIATATPDTHRTANGLFVKEGPFEWYEESGGQCGACARGTLSIYYFDLSKGTSTLAFTYTNIFDQNDSDFEISPDWLKLTDFEFGPAENADENTMYDVSTYRWTAKSYCFSGDTMLYRECGVKYNVAPPRPRHFQPTRAGLI